MLIQINVFSNNSKQIYIYSINIYLLCKVYPTESSISGRILFWKSRYRVRVLEVLMCVTTTGSSSGVVCPSDMISGTVCALLAGCLGSAASLSAKLSLGADYLRDMCEGRLSGGTRTHAGASACDWVRSTSQQCLGVWVVCQEKSGTFTLYSQYILQLTEYDCCAMYI